MTKYSTGDVILARIRIEGRGEMKARPAVVISTSAGGDPLVYPISHTPSWNQPSIPLTLHDFTEGGLDILDESYVLTGQAQKISSFSVIGKKGRLSKETMEALCPGHGTG